MGRPRPATCPFSPEPYLLHAVGQRRFQRLPYFSLYPLAVDACYYCFYGLVPILLSLAVSLAAVPGPLSLC